MRRNEIKPLKRNLIAFLEALTGEVRNADPTAELPR